MTNWEDELAALREKYIQQEKIADRLRVELAVLHDNYNSALRELQRVQVEKNELKSLVDRERADRGELIIKVKRLEHELSRKTS